MSNTISGGISFSGIGGGTDFNEVIDKLYEIESIRLTGLEDSREVAMESYDAMTELINAVTESKEALSLLNNPAKFLLKLASSSNEGVATATADYEAVDGTFTVDVQQLATNAIWASKSTYASQTTIVNDSGAPTTLSYTYKGETREINVPENTTLEGLAYMINEDKANPGVKMQIIKVADGYTFQIAGTESGEGADLEIIPNSSLVGFGGMSGDSSIWESYGAGIDPTHALNDGQMPNAGYTYTFTFAGSSGDEVYNITHDVNGNPLNGGSTYGEIAAALNKEYRDRGNTGSLASFSNGNLSMPNLKSMTTTGDGNIPSEQVAPTMSAQFNGNSGTPVHHPATYTFQTTGGPIPITTDEGDTLANIFDKLVTADTTGTVGMSFVDNGDGTSTINFQGISGLPPELIFTEQTTPAYNFSTPATESAAVQANIIPNNLTFNITLDDGTVVDPPLSIANTASYQDLANAINGLYPGTASFEDVDPADPSRGQKLILNGVASFSSSSSEFNDNMNFGGSVTSASGWTVQNAQNAEFKINNFAHTLTSSTNDVTGVIEGVTLSLKSTGTTQVGIASDTDSVKANIQTVLDALNAVILKVKDLTAISEEPTSTYSEDATITASALSGEYSVQSFLSRMKGEIIGNPPGFQTMTTEDIFSGDFIATLSQMGIKTVADKDDPNFGLFAIAPSGSVEELQAFDQQLFDEALANNMEDVINFFASDDSGTTSSDDFGYTNHIDGITEPGTYDVRYTVTEDASGNISTQVFINNKLASPSDINPNTYTVGGDGPEAGISITLYDLGVGEHSGTVSIQRGLVPTMEDFFTKEMQFYPADPEDPTIGQSNGGLMIAQDSYKQLIESIDNQIYNEMDRLERWEYNERLKYARLDTLLGEYNSQMEYLNSQLGQLG